MIDPTTYPHKPPPADVRPRPTLIIGLGGTGHRIAAGLKALAIRGWGEEQVARWLKFLVFDTAQESLTVDGVSLEPGTEFIDIGQTPVANIKRNLERQTAIKERFGSLLPHLPPAVLRNGAKQLRPLGLLAFYWRYAEVEERLHNAIWELANRQHSEGRDGINVFIASSLVGGTGSSTFLDVAHLVRDLFDSLGHLADFCYVTGVGVLPRAFHGVQGPNLIPNAVASLVELNHCMMRGGFQARYPNGRVIRTEQPPFNIFYLVDGVDERGRTWYGLSDVCRMAAEALFLQIGSQVGEKSQNDFDNLDEVLVQQTDDGDGTFHGSFGLASLLFDGPAVARACAARQALRLIDRGLLGPAAGPQPDDLLTGLGLDPERLLEQLACDDQGLPLAVDLAVPGFADRLPIQQRPARLVQYVRDYERVRLGSDYRQWLHQNQGRLAQAVAELLPAQANRRTSQAGLPAAEAYLTGLLNQLERTIDRHSARQAENEGKLEALAETLAHQESLFLQAGEGLPLWRARRVLQAQAVYFSAAEQTFSLRWQTYLTGALLAILSQAAQTARHLLAGCHEAAARLRAARRLLAQTADVVAAQPGDGVTAHSLAGEAVVAALFDSHAPPVAEAMTTLFSRGASALDWRDSPPDVLAETLLDACRPPFAPVAAMTVEEALSLQEEFASPEAAYTWLMGQATPSWNLDRTRLLDGGAGLQRLEVLGVPDEGRSRFRRRAAMLVSTADPTRLVAFVAHVGAAHTAVQQWDSYRADYERVRGRAPLHILPHFQTDNAFARQTFALGTLFGFIRSQGAYFYYHPDDQLERPTRLAQGLANALQAFVSEDGLVRRTRERVEGAIAHQGVETTLRQLTAYYDNSGGRYSADDLVLELKQLVRDYADELRQIRQFTAGNSYEQRNGGGHDG